MIRPVLQKNDILGINALGEIEDLEENGIRVNSWQVDNKLSLFKVQIDSLNDIKSYIPRDNYKSNFFTILLIKEGSINVKINLEEYNVPKNSLLAITPGYLREIISVPSVSNVEGMVFTSSIFNQISMFTNPEDLLDFFSSKFMPFWSVDTHETKSLSEMVDRLSRKIEDRGVKRFGNESFMLTFYEFLIEVQESALKHHTEVNIQFGRKEELVAKFSQLAKKHHLSERNLSFYSDKLFITSKHLSETVKEVIGIPAGKLLDQLNILEAKRLLEQSNLNISEISDHLGFSSPAFFTKFFDRMEGLSPREYRKLAKK